MSTRFLNTSVAKYRFSHIKLPTALVIISMANFFSFFTLSITIIEQTHLNPHIEHISYFFEPQPAHRRSFVLGNSSNKGTDREATVMVIVCCVHP